MKLYLGRVSKTYKGFLSGEAVWLEKHSWNCGWYWGFGYVGNKNTHTHFDSEFLVGITSVHEIFSGTKLTQAQWWQVRDMFIQAYALKNAAEAYKYGGHNAGKPHYTVKNDTMNTQINKDLGDLLNALWSYLETCLS